VAARLTAGVYTANAPRSRAEGLAPDCPAPAGGDAGVHSHSAAYQAVVVSGTHKHWLPGDKKVKPLKPGSYVRQPGGQPHGDTCTGDSECVLFLIMEGKFDFTPTPDVKEVAAGTPSGSFAFRPNPHKLQRIHENHT
jgi:hypothetical protein